MNTSHSTPSAGRQLDLPMYTFFSVRKCGGRTIAHALHFDLVSSAPTTEEALRKLRAAVKRHIEFGFDRGLSQDDILLSAPQECWDRIAGAPLTLGENIEVLDQRIQILSQTAIDESQPVPAVA